MMHSEFCEISGQQVSYKVYAEKFEPMYLALDVDKREFIEFMMPVIKAVAKQEKMDREAEGRKQQKLVFVSDGSKTPNGCYYYGRFYKLTGCDIRTGKALVRELTEEEYNEEVCPHYSGYCKGSYDIIADRVKVVA